MNIAILGANGQLAFDLKRTLTAHDLIPFTRADFDVTNTGAMRRSLSEARPEVIINTTAFHQVDVCESRPDEAFGVNAVAVFHLAGLAAELDATLVHISTDYVFDGESRKPYGEDSPTRPISTYANSKLAGEFFVRSIPPKHFLIRTCGLYGVAGSAGKGGNFVETMIRKARAGDDIRVVSDQIVSPTPTADLAGQISALLETDHYGLFHASSGGSCSWYDFACAIFELADMQASLEPTTKEFQKTPATRPAYSVMENVRFGALDLDRMSHWREGLVAYLKEKHGIGCDGS